MGGGQTLLGSPANEAQRPEAPSLWSVPAAAPREPPGDQCSTLPCVQSPVGNHSHKGALSPAKQLYKPQGVAFTPRILFLEVRAAIRRKQHATRGLTHFLRCTDQQSTIGNAGKRRRELVTNMRACNATICG